MSAEEKALKSDILPKGFTPFIQPIKKEVEGKTKELGKVDWSSQFIEAKGESVLDPERFKNPAQAKAMATRGAVVVAQRNLLEIVKGVHVQGETTVEDMMTKRDLITTRVEGIVKGAQINHPDLLQEKRKTMKILLVDPTKDIPLKTLNVLFKEMLALYQ
jgi:hypothetical protein